MNAVRVAWRLRAVAVAASALPFAAMLALHYCETEVYLAWGGDGMLRPLLDTLYLFLSTLIIGVILQAALAVPAPSHWRRCLLPDIRVALFALALAPIEFAGAQAQHEFIDWLAFREAVDGIDPGAWFMPVYTVAGWPEWPWLLAGPLVPVAAILTLNLARLSRRPNPLPNVALILIVVAAILMSSIIERGIIATTHYLPAGQLWDRVAEVSYNLAWYVARMLMLTLIAAASAVLLVRRAAQPAEA